MGVRFHGIHLPALLAGREAWRRWIAAIAETQ